MKSVARALPRTVTVSAPPAKAYTLRALLLGALAEGRVCFVVLFWPTTSKR